jgi:hypothetical protein
MGILDWFKNRPAQFDADRVSEELIRGAVDKAITVTNPRLVVLPGCHKRLAPAAEKAIEFLRALLAEMPAARPLSADGWSAEQDLRAYFVAPADIAAVLARSDNLRTLFDKYIDLEQAYVVLGMSFNEQRVFGMALQGDMVQRDVAQTSVSFSDHRTHLCGRDEARLRRVVGAQAFEYLLAQALAEIGEERIERQELESNRSLLRARLRLLRQQGPGLGSLFGSSAPAARSEQAQLEAELLENERQLAAMGGNESALEMELDSLIEVLENPQRYLRVERRHLRLNPMNIIVERENGEPVIDLDVHLAMLSGSTPTCRAVVVGRVGRDQMAPAPRMNLADAARYL